MRRFVQSSTSHCGRSSWSWRSLSFDFREHWRLLIIGEVFNLYNAANLSGHSGNLTSAAFGQPTIRATQIFGSGGPRAFQLATRLSF